MGRLCSIPMAAVGGGCRSIKSFSMGKDVGLSGTGVGAGGAGAAGGGGCDGRLRKGDGLRLRSVEGLANAGIDDSE